MPNNVFLLCLGILLVITNVTSHVLQAQNELHLTVGNIVVGAPRGLTILSITKSTAFVSWEEPLTLGKNVTEYRLQVASYPEGTDPTTSRRFTNAEFKGVCRGQALNCTVERLVPGKYYRFRVRAAVKLSFGSYSQPLDFMFPTVPPAPSPPRALSSTPTTITIAWDPTMWADSTLHGNISTLSCEYLAPIIGYEISAGLGPASPLNITFTKESNQTKLDLDNLNPGSLYRFRVRAWNKVGFSDWSEIAASFTTSNTPGVPENITFSTISFDSCKVKWLAPPENGARVIAYDILLVEVNSEKIEPMQIVYSGGGGVTQASITKLHPGWSYGFKFRAHNGNGAGQFSSIQTVRMLDPVPNRPPPPTLLQSTPTSLLVFFNQSSESNGAIVTHYELFVAQEFADSHVTTFSSSYKGPRQSYLLQNLVVGSCYRFRVTAITDTKTVSPPSHDGRACTQSTVPSTPLAPHVVNITSTSFSVRWSAPTDHGSQIVRYHLEMMGPAQNPSDEGESPKMRKRPLSVLGSYTKVYSGPLSSFEARTLLPDTIYYVRVIAENSVGDSLTSNITIAKTLPTLPSKASVPKVISVEATRLIISFEPGQRSEYETLPINEMELQVAEGTEAESGGEVALWKQIYKGYERSFALGSLTPNHGYRFRVRSLNDMGSGPWSTSLSTKTASDGPDTVSIFTIEEKDPSHVVISWVPPNDNGELIRTYRVDVAVEEDSFQRSFSGLSQSPKLGKWKTVQVDSRNSVKLLDGLHIKRAQFIAIRVRASNIAGDSAWSAPFALWTKPDDSGLPFPPDQVQAPELSLISSIGATVSWPRPDGNGAPITKFDVQVALVDDSICESNPSLGKPMVYDCSKMILAFDTIPMGGYRTGCKTLSDAGKRIPASLTCDLVDLEEGSKYMVRVIAYNFVGQSFPSPPSLLSLFSNGHGIPPTPEAPYVAFTDTASVLLRWTDQFLPNTGTSQVIDSYDVGISIIPTSQVHKFTKLNSDIQSSKQKLGKAQQKQEQTEQQKQQEEEEQNEKLMITFQNAYQELQSLLSNSTFLHVYRGSNSTDSLFFLAEGLVAGGTYAFKVRGVDSEKTGEWSDGVVITLSPDVPVPAPAPRLVDRGPNYITIEITDPDAQGSPILYTVLELSIVQSVSAGIWAAPKPIAVFNNPYYLGSSNNNNATVTTTTTTATGSDDSFYSFQKVVRNVTIVDLPANTPFAFRVGSANAVGMGSFGEMSRYFTSYAPLAKPAPPRIRYATKNKVAMQFSLPPRGTRPAFTNSIKRVENYAKNHNGVKIPLLSYDPLNPNHLFVSGDEFLLLTQQTVDLSASHDSKTYFQLVADIEDDRSLAVVCNVTTTSCEFDNIRPHTTIHTKLRVIESWGASDWSDVVAVTTLNSQPDAPLEAHVTVSPLKTLANISWVPPESNGEILLNFDVYAGVVPQRLFKFVSSVVGTRMPNRKFVLSPTTSIRPFFMSFGQTTPPASVIQDSESSILKSNNNNNKVIQLIPNKFSPEAIATSQLLPETDDIPFPPEQIKDVQEDDDFTLNFLQLVAQNVTDLSYLWKYPLNLSQIEEPSMFITRVRARNRLGAGPLSPIMRFYASASSAASPPNQPETPMLARATTNSLVLEWETPNGNGAQVNLYVLKMRVSQFQGKDSEDFHDVYVGSSTSFEIKGLVPSQLYYFYLIAYNSVGHSPPSNLVLFQTLRD
eukprot:c21747_g2_i1.p1 GENE.c21747_g2_i1~~c21747_g2_i1.p1  ORF type:complete len:1695 (+),score=823.65 c21747_g2_i1:29-5113(+)